MKLTVMILAGGKAKRLGVDKAFISIMGKPLILRTLEGVYSITDDIIIVTKTIKRLKKLKQLIKYPAKFLIDAEPSIESPLIGVLTGLKEAKYEHVFLIGCDMPLIKLEVVEFLAKSFSNTDINYGAIIPRYPNGYIEPLCAIYTKSTAINAVESTLIERKFRFVEFIAKIPAVHYIPVSKIQQIDPDLHTFFNVNTKYDLVKLLKIIEEKEVE
ncbi:MAG: molybdenum cofactor guanylyltransferase [Candidatus Helarchaeota archaeon]